MPDKRPEPQGTPPVSPAGAPPIPQAARPQIEMRETAKVKPGVIIQNMGNAGPNNEFTLVGVWLSHYAGDPAKKETVENEDAQYRQVALFTMERTAWEEFDRSLMGPLPGKDSRVYQNPALLTIR